MRVKTIVPEGFNKDLLLKMAHETEAAQKKELESVQSRIIRAYRRGERQLETTWKMAGIAPALRDQNFTVVEQGPGQYLIKW